MDNGLLLKIVNFFFEAGTSKNIVRSHLQFLRGVNDTVASHSFRTTIFGMILAKLEGVDEGKVLKMCLLHDFPEIRTGDANFLNAQYRQDRKGDEVKANADQWQGLPVEKDVMAAMEEYETRKSKESIVAKDADVLDQIILQIEHFAPGSYDLTRWHNHQAKKLQTASAKAIAELAVKTNPLEWLYKFSDEKQGKQP